MSVNISALLDGQVKIDSSTNPYPKYFMNSGYSAQVGLDGYINIVDNDTHAITYKIKYADIISPASGSMELLCDILNADPYFYRRVGTSATVSNCAPPFVGDDFIITTNSASNCVNENPHGIISYESSANNNNGGMYNTIIGLDCDILGGCSHNSIIECNECNVNNSAGGTITNSNITNSNNSNITTATALGATFCNIVGSDICVIEDGNISGIYNSLQSNIVQGNGCIVLGGGNNVIGDTDAISYNNSIIGGGGNIISTGGGAYTPSNNHLSSCSNVNVYGDNNTALSSSAGLLPGTSCTLIATNNCTAGGYLTATEASTYAESNANTTFTAACSGNIAGPIYTGANNSAILACYNSSPSPAGIVGLYFSGNQLFMAGCSNSILYDNFNNCALIASDATTVTPVQDNTLFCTNRHYYGGVNYKSLYTTIDYNILPSDHIICADPDPIAITLYLPSSPLNGATYCIKTTINCSAINTVTIDGGLINIDGSFTYVFNAPNQSITIIYIQGEWRIVSQLI